MPLVFIHGVNVRDDETYERETTQRNQFFENVFFKLLGVKKPTILNPYWGAQAPPQAAPGLTQGETEDPGHRRHR
jgi:hypothetical protein